MFANAVEKLQKSLFPIFYYQQLPHGVELSTGASGFFINSQGHFATVAHAFDKTNQGLKYVYWGRLIEDLAPHPFDISIVAVDDQEDIAIGKININPPDFLQLHEELPPLGRSICIAGYPLAVISINATGGFELGGVRRYLQPTFVLDHLEAKSHVNGKIRFNRGFLARDFGLFGMSGGPAVDIEGKAYGIQASVTEPRISTNGIRSITVENALIIKSSLVRELANKHKIPLT